jgi:hypothetical protein
MYMYYVYGWWKLSRGGGDSQLPRGDKCPLPLPNETLEIVPHYIPGSNLLFCGYEIIVIHDETYSIIDEVIMRKFRASMEPF